MFFLVLLVHRTTTRHTLSQKSRGAEKGHQREYKYDERKKKRGKLEVATPRFEPAPQLPPAQKVKPHATWVHRGHKGHRGRKGKQGTQGDTGRHKGHRETQETQGTQGDTGNIRDTGDTVGHKEHSWTEWSQGGAGGAQGT